MRARLFPGAGQEEYLEPKEIVGRIAISMPTILIDWARGDQVVEEKLKTLIAMNTPEVILTSHRTLFGETVYIEVFFPEFSNEHVFFLIQPGSRIEIESSNLKNVAMLRHAAEKLAAVLNYDFKIVE